MLFWRKTRRKLSRIEQDVNGKVSEQLGVALARDLREVKIKEVESASATVNEQAAAESQPTQKEVRIDGALDHFQSPNIFQGWALHPAQSATPLRVRIKRDGTVIGSGATSIRRRDMVKEYPENCAGFLLHTESAVDPGEIVSGRLRVVILDERGKEHVLRTYHLLKERLAMADPDAAAHL